MSLTAQAEYLADLGALASRSAECFCMARCAGADVKAIGPSAKAAVVLGASLPELHASLPPFGDDREYLEECAAIRIAICWHGEQVRALEREAGREMSAAPEEMCWDASRAASICIETLSRLDQADRAMAWAPVKYAQVYEVVVQHVAQGGQLPHDGRWITGEPQNAGNPAAGAAR
jgi:hypothetical protein